MKLHRDRSGVMHVQAVDEIGIYRGLGIAHAHDRGLQMLFMRIIGRGRAAEVLDSSLVETDRFVRRMNWHGGLTTTRDRLSPRARALAAAYAGGVNHAFRKSVPWEMRLLRNRPEPWRIEDSILLSRMSGYLTLAQSQGELERWIVELVQGGLPAELLEALFPGRLGGLDLELLRKVHLTERVVPEQVSTLAAGARMMASNNWAVSGANTASGRALLANDPHLDISQLPALWYEVMVQAPDRYAVGATMPGVIGLLIGRTPDLAWGATYSFADATDSWIEEVRDLKVRRGDDWLPLRARIEAIAKKGGDVEEVTFWETDDHGVLEGDPTQDGYYLSTRWSGADSGARSTEAIVEMWQARTVAEGMAHLGAIETSFNWVLADRDGHIGYQMSGLLPIRREGWSGLVPVPGWDPANDWRGFHSPAVLPRSLDPSQGFLVTANNDLNDLGTAQVINAAMGTYRANRIAELLTGRNDLDSETMKRIQLDVHSKQAELLLEVLKPLLPDTPDGEAIRGWDCRYDAESCGAEAFERFYDELLRTVFGPALGHAAVDFLAAETGLFTDFYSSFDTVVMAERSPWFGGRTREELFAEVAERALSGAPRPWGEVRKVMQRHVLFGGKIPRWLGFDRGPLTLVGSRATPHQGQIYRSAERLVTFAPSYRFVVDFAEVGLESSLAGGASDRRFSRWYYSEAKAWRAGRYKKLRPTVLAD
ncbi:penicillin acylase family protein [Lentzea pudingi]|uniref:penicillin acylase family protein n=1 Tax=Lentzea pudingi TaxID=1789439 RepID=UPI001664F89A|nr:penicillin acylase family protein [Lentzea pudingi]